MYLTGTDFVFIYSSWNSYVITERGKVEWPINLTAKCLSAIFHN